jgi:phosphoglycerate dehydrogenase-like enzyme
MATASVALMYGEIAAAKVEELSAHLSSEWQIDVWVPGEQTEEEFAQMLLRADVLIGGPIPTRHWPQAPNLKLYQVPWAGYDWARVANVPNGVPLCNVYEHEIPIAEYVIATILESKIGLRRMDTDFRRGGWNGRGPAQSLFHGEVHGQTIGIIGYGHIGEEVAKRATAFGMKVVGTRRSKQPTPPLLDWLGTTERNDDLLAQSDYVLIACDLNDDTRGMVDEQMLAKMKPDAWIINVSRGAVINEQALFDALTNDVIGGAAIDTWYNYPSRKNPEPKPSNLPFEDLPNTILTAHESGWTKQLVTRRWAFVAQNIERLRAGEALENIAFTGTAATGDASQ